MANRHYGEVGDLWKHLPLAQLLRLHNPRLYAESHAGSALYPIRPTWQRDFGVLRFLSRSADHPAFRNSHYRAALTSLPAGPNNPLLYPGSPWLALSALAASDCRFTFCDTDPNSLATIRTAAAGLGIAADRLSLEAADGNAVLMALLTAMPKRDRRRALIMLDPYDTLDAAPGSPSSAEVFALAARLGCPALLWYGYSRLTRDDRPVNEKKYAIRDELLAAYAAALADAGVKPDIARCTAADIHLDIINDDDPPNPGVLGCGLLIANLEDDARRALHSLGSALPDLYTDARLPGGRPGSTRFEWLDLPA